MPGFRAGFIGIVGQTNVGKSTFLNAVMGEKLLISSPRPQSTRVAVRCILTREDAQLVFVDTPGLHHPRNRLGQSLQREARRSVRELDVIAYMTVAHGKVAPFDREQLERLSELDKPLVLLVNKIDRAKGNELEETLLAYAAFEALRDLVPVSATRRLGLREAVETLILHLPERPLVFPAEVRCDRPETFLVEETIREKAIEATYDELPYALAVRVQWMREREDGLMEIRAEILVNRESQKAIIIGRKAEGVRRVGMRARADLERLLGRRVFLDLHVSARPGWTASERDIRELTGAQ
ncbi:MAG: GTPase Era [Candidatus Bipolaricaulota bacterium]